MKASTIERLQRVAAVYREAAMTGAPPTQAVAQREEVSYSAAAKLVWRTRLAGLLPATTPGVVTRPPHSAATAVVDRNTAHEHTWTVCRSCLVAWPCPAWRSSET